jgi:dCMP deaminase
MKHKIKVAHMRAAKAYAECSSAKRLKVGAIIVKNGAVISIGFNGTPPGWDNNCEDIEYMPSTSGLFSSEWPLVEKETGRRYRLVTKPEVNHAEANALDKLCKTTGNSDGADIFLTHAPCLECAKRIFNVGIKNVFYQDFYRDSKGLAYLNKAGVNVEQINVDD